MVPPLPPVGLPFISAMNFATALWMNRGFAGPAARACRAFSFFWSFFSVIVPSLEESGGSGPPPQSSVRPSVEASCL
jgi:hypothetical protein